MSAVGFHLFFVCGIDSASDAEIMIQMISEACLTYFTVGRIFLSMNDGNTFLYGEITPVGTCSEGLLRIQIKSTP